MEKCRCITIDIHIVNVRQIMEKCRCITIDIHIVNVRQIMEKCRCITIDIHIVNVRQIMEKCRCITIDIHIVNVRQIMEKCRCITIDIHIVNVRQIMKKCRCITIDIHIVNVRQIMEKCSGHNIPLYMRFIDYSKAFDCVSHGQLWNIMRTMGFPEHLISLICKLYGNHESAVRTGAGITEWFKVGRGVRQGCNLSPSLYNLYAEDIMRTALEEKVWGVKVGNDTTLLSSSKAELLQMISAVKEASQPRGLLLNVKKTQIMVNDNNRLDHTDFMIDGERISEVEEFVYLGSNITKECSCRTEVTRRLAMARTAALNMTSIWKSRGVSTKLKTRLLRATTLTLYGCESWAITKADQGKVDAFEMWAYRRVLMVSWTTMKTNKWVLDKIGNSLVLRSQRMERKLKFFGHVMRHESFEKGIIQGMVEAKRKRGRPPR